MKQLLSFFGLLAVPLVLGACGEDPVPINEVSFTAADYSFKGPASIPAGMDPTDDGEPGPRATSPELVKATEEIHHGGPASCFFS